MLMHIYVVYDSCSGCYGRPFVARSEGEAVRSFADICCDASHPYGQHPEHYSLYRLGTYDDNTANIESCPATHVSNGHELVAASRKIAPGSLKEFNGDGDPRLDMSADELIAGADESYGGTE